MKRVRTLAAALATVSVLGGLTGCEDLFEDGSLQPDGSKPSLTINNPSNNQVILADQGVRVNITAVDKDEFKSIDFLLKGSGGEKPLIDFKKYADQKVLEFDTLVSTSNFAPGTYTLLITATDKRTNVSEQQVNFTVK